MCVNDPQNIARTVYHLEGITCLQDEARWINMPTVGKQEALPVKVSAACAVIEHLENESGLCGLCVPSCDIYVPRTHWWGVHRA